MVMIMTSLVLMSSCGSNSNDIYNKDPFLAYMRDEGYIDKKDGKFTVVMPSGNEIDYDIMRPLAKDKKSEHVVLSMGFYAGRGHSWVTECSNSDKKKDLAFLGDCVIGYAKANGWSNDYDLYIDAEAPYSNCDYVYNYETDSLYVPESEEIWIDAYEKCGSWLRGELEDTPEGQEWLIDHGLGEIKHGEFESKDNYSMTSSYNVRVYDGEFYEHGENHSICY